MSEQSQISNSQSLIAFVFPGQGSQAVGMGKDLFDNYPEARAVFQEADEALGFKLSEMCFAGDEGDLQLTANTQPAILTTSIAALTAMRSAGFPEPAYVAGHSLGEYSALVAAGALSFADAVRTVRKRGQYMQEAVPPGVGAMAAILGANLETVEAVCQEVSENEICSPANINSPSQIVIAGNAAAIDQAIEKLKERGAKRAIKLNVSAPFHCALMYAAQEKLARDLQKVNFKDLKLPVIENVTAQPNDKGARVAESLTEQVSSPVRWAQSVETLLGFGVKTFVEVGAGKVLCGLIRQINRDARCLNVESRETLENALNVLNSEEI